MTASIRQLDLDDPDDQKVLARLKRSRQPLERLYLVSDEASGQSETSTEDILGPQTSTKATADHLGQLMVDRRAAALHCDPHPDRVWVRVRIDGRLQRLGSLPVANYQDLIDYLKIQAGLELEADICQAGQVDWPAGKRSLPGRLQISPAVNGPKLVFQPWQAKAPFDLGTIGFWGQTRRQVEQALGQNRGLILFTGDNWPGRRLGLEAAEGLLVDDQRLSLASLTGQPDRQHPHQTLIQPAWGQTRANWLATQANGDADVLVVDQLLDRRSCQLAVETAASRKLVLTTIAGRTSAEAIGTLLAGQVEPHLLTAARPTVVTVRLVRRLKPRPKPEKKTAGGWLKNPVWAEFDLNGQNRRIESLVDQAALAAAQIGGQLIPPPAGPPADSDYRGQILLITVEAGRQLEDLPAAGPPRAAAPGTAVDLKDDGLIKICLGLTSPAEVKRALSGQRQLAGQT